MICGDYAARPISDRRKPNLLWVFLRTMTKGRIFDTPSDVTAIDGIVSLKGPDAVDVELTAGAADGTSDRLLEASLKARGQILREQQRGKR